MVPLITENHSFLGVSSYRKGKQYQIFIRMAGQTFLCSFSGDGEITGTVGDGVPVLIII
jgi:hypothetical protein